MDDPFWRLLHHTAADLAPIYSCVLFVHFIHASNMYLTLKMVMNVTNMKQKQLKQFGSCTHMT